MNLLNNLVFKQKLILLVLIPLLATLYFSLSNLMALTSEQEQLEELQELITLTIVNNALVHELQKERGATAVYIGSKGDKFSHELTEQRKLTNKAQIHLNEKLNSFISDNDKVNSIILTIKSGLLKLDGIRTRSDELSIPLNQAIGYYTAQNHKMLSLTGFFSVISPTETVSNSIGYYALLEAKERSGIERAVASGSFAKDRFTQAAFQKFTSLVALQDSYLEQFSAKASLKIVNAYKNTLKNNDAIEVGRMREVAVSVGQNGPFNVDAGAWFNSATGRINLLKDIENLVADEFIVDINQLLSEANSKVIVNLIIIISTFLITIFIIYVILANLIKQLNEISVTMEKVTEQNDLSIQAGVFGVFQGSCRLNC